MKTKNILALSLALIITVLAASCGTTEEPGTSDTETTQSDQTESNKTTAQTGIPKMPDADLKGFELHLAKQTQDTILLSNVSFAVSEENGEVLNDALYKRNIKMMEKYNFTLAETEFANPYTTLNTQNLSGDNEFDIFLITLNKINTIANADSLVDFHDVPNLMLEGAWWDQDMLRDLDIGGGQFFMNGDIILSIYDCLYVIMYNKGLAEDLGLSGFYDLVNSGKWTLDKMYNMMVQASNDINNDGIMDYRDVFGMLYNDSLIYAHTVAQNLKLINSDGELGVFTNKFASVYENLLKIFKKELTFNYNTDKYPGLDARQAIVTMFDNKQVLFFENGISAAAQYMRNLKNVDFGFLPIPKYDEDQEKYYSTVANSAPVLCIPVTNNGDRIENTGFVLEALCRESSENVIPEYFETCFSAKYTHDAESYDMILLATESRMYDIGVIFDYGKIQSTIRTAVRNQDEAIMSKLESIRETVIAEFNANNAVK